MKGHLALALLLSGTSVAMAQAPDIRPIPRDAGAQSESLDGPRPEPRPAVDVALPGPQPLPRPQPISQPEVTRAELIGLATSLVPSARPGDWPEGEPVTQSEPEQPELAGPIGSHELTIRGGLFGGGTRVLSVPAFADDSATAVLLSPLPELRPDGLEARVRAAATRGTPARVTELGRRGQLCGSAGIFGEELEPIVGRISGCGITEPVRVREVDGIALSTPATINCNAALALQEWLGEARDIVGRTGGGITQIRVVASYSCRTRNNQAGARLSEHSFGNGIDIAGIGLANGSELTLLTGWRDGTQGPILRRLHEAACGPFGTVLGPESDRYHQDHFHFDVADYRSGSYCR